MPPRTRKTAAKKTTTPRTPRTTKKASASPEDLPETPSDRLPVHHGDERSLAPTERRYIAKSEPVGRRIVWGVYDRQRASWPLTVPVLGKVKQDLETEEEAQAEADRCEATR